MVVEKRVFSKLPNLLSFLCESLEVVASKISFLLVMRAHKLIFLLLTSTVLGLVPTVSLCRCGFMGSSINVLYVCRQRSSLTASSSAENGVEGGSDNNADSSGDDGDSDMNRSRSRVHKQLLTAAQRRQTWNSVVKLEKMLPNLVKEQVSVVLGILTTYTPLTHINNTYQPSPQPLTTTPHTGL